MRSLLAFASTALFLGLVACSASEASDGSEEGTESDVITADKSGMKAQPSDTCVAELVYLQKDAYKTTPGHANEMWPARV